MLDGIVFFIKLDNIISIVVSKINNYIILMNEWFNPYNAYKCCNKLNLYVTTNHRGYSHMVCTNTYKCCHDQILCVAILQRLLLHVTNT